MPCAKGSPRSPKRVQEVETPLPQMVSTPPDTPPGPRNAQHQERPNCGVSREIKEIEGSGFIFRNGCWSNLEARWWTSNAPAEKAQGARCRAAEMTHFCSKEEETPNI